MNQSSNDVYAIIGETLGFPAADLKPEMALRSLPNTESIQVLTIILKVEKRFGIEIPDDATFRLETVGQFLELVDELRARAAPPAGAASVETRA